MSEAMAYKTLREDAACDLEHIDSFGHVAVLLQQILKATARQISAEALRTYVEAAAIYFEGRADQAVLAVEGRVTAAALEAQDAAQASQELAKEATTLLQVAAEDTKEFKAQLGSSMKEMQDLVLGLTTLTSQLRLVAASQEEGEIPSGTIPHAPFGDAHTTFPSPNNAKSYAAVTAQAVAEQLLRPTHASTIARGDGTAKQLVLSLDPGAGETDSLASLSDKELVDKARMALDSTIGLGEQPSNMSFAVARRQQQGRKVLLQLNSAEAAEWLRQTDVLWEFQGHFSGSYLVKPSVFEVIVEYAPISLELDDAALFRRIEQESALTEQTLVGGRWLRKPERQSEGQKKAFIAIGCRTRHSANQLIRDGCIMDGNLLNARKPRPEPLRCAKCQRLNGKHVARTCPSPHDVCARCSGQHKTADCKAKGTDGLRCTNCHGNHAASDRSCRVFQEHLKWMQNQQPDMAYTYYPTNEPWTWAREHEIEMAIHSSRPAPLETRHTPKQYAAPPNRKDAKSSMPFFASQSNRVPIGQHRPRTQTQLMSWLEQGNDAEVPASHTFDWSSPTPLGQAANAIAPP